MATLDTVIEMQSQGMPDAEIIQRLRNENISPREINDALNQAKVKTAVSQPMQEEQFQEMQNPSEMQNMQQSIMQPQDSQDFQAFQPPQQMQQIQGEQQMPQEQPPQMQQQEYYYPETPQAYSGQEYYPQTGMDTDTITEIAEQVVIEKFSEFSKKTGDLVSFKNEIQEKVQDLIERLKRIEDNIDNLQQSIIGKVGEFGESTATIHQDLDNLHNTVSKLMNPLIDNYKELKKISKEKE